MTTEKIPLAKPSLGRREEELVLDVLRSGRLSLGPMQERFERMGLQADRIHFDFVGLNVLHGPAAPLPHADRLADCNEVGLRCAVHARTADEAEKVRRAGAHLWIMGPGGTSFGTPIKPRPVVSLWPTLVPRELVPQTTTILEA